VRSSFLPRLINSPFGDPGLYVALRWLGRALLFDLGSLERLPASLLTRVGHIFVSHTHLDHFIGFDRVLRVFLGRADRVHVYGPKGFTENVAGKLRGYTWNLVENYRFSLAVHEVRDDRVLRTRMAAHEEFRPVFEEERPFTGVLHEEEAFTVRATILDHRIPCLAFAVSEPTHLNVRVDALERLGLPPGPWLSNLKRAIRAGLPDEAPFTIQYREHGQLRETTFPLGQLRRTLILESKGMKIGYVVDVLFHAENVHKVVELVRGADVLFCESLFLDQDRDEATKRYHLTARQAGTIARLAQVGQLKTFHFSPRYSGRASELHAEAQATFRGDIPPDEP
jgi:ribonuclease Z